MGTDGDAYTFIVSGPPVPFDRVLDAVGTDGRRRKVLPARYRDWKKAAAGRIGLERRGVVLRGPVTVGITVAGDYVKIDLAALNGSSRPARVRGDLDNYVKAVLDALTDSGIITDDDQINFITATFANDPDKLGAKQ